MGHQLRSGSALVRVEWTYVRSKDLRRADVDIAASLTYAQKATFGHCSSLSPRPPQDIRQSEAWICTGLDEFVATVT